MTATETGAEAQAPGALFSGSMSAGQRLRAILGGSSGNLVEWYDVYVYTVFATYFEGQFFEESEKNSTVYVYAIFAITFVRRFRSCARESKRATGRTMNRGRSCSKRPERPCTHPEDAWRPWNNCRERWRPSTTCVQSFAR